MNINIGKDPGFKSKQSFLAVVFCSVLIALSACGSDSSDSGVVEYSDHQAFNFDAANTELAAEIAASSMSFFPVYAELSHLVITIFRSYHPMYSPFSLSAVLCASGKAILYWGDNDLSRDFSAGDTGSLYLTDCDLLNGAGDTVSASIEIAFSTVEESQPGFSSTYTADVDMTFSSAADTTGFTARVGGNVNTADGKNFSSTYKAADMNDQTLTITENGADYFTLGCFSVTASFENLVLLNDRTLALSFSGPINASDKILSLDDVSTVSLLLGVFDSGNQRLLSMSEPNCSATGTLNDVADSDGSYLDMKMLGGGVVELITYNLNGDQTFSIVTTWDQLIN